MAQTVHDILVKCLHLEFNVDHLLLHSSFEPVRFDLDYQPEDAYFSIMFIDKVIGGMKLTNGRLTGKINLSDISSYNTCLLIQLSREEINDCMLLQPLSSKAKYSPQKTNFITKEDFAQCLI